MFNTEEKAIIGIIVGVAGTLIASVIGYLANRRSKVIEEQIGRTVDELKRKDYSSEIAREFVEEAARASVNNYVANMMAQVKKDVLRASTDALEASVKAELHEHYNDIHSSVKEEVKKQIGDIDIVDAKREVIYEAKKEAAKIFAEDQRRVLEEYHNLALDKVKYATDIWAAVDKKIKSI